MDKGQDPRVPKEPVTKAALMSEVCHACGGMMPHCDSDVVDACYRQHLQRHPQIVILAVVPVPVNPAGERALASYGKLVEGMQVPPSERARASLLADIHDREDDGGYHTPDSEGYCQKCGCNLLSESASERCYA